MNLCGVHREQPDTLMIESMKMGQELKTSDELKASDDQKTGEESGTSEECKKDEIKPDEKMGEALRRSPRLSCSGLAGVQTLPVCDKPCPSKIMDLSIGGCLMEFERPLTLAIDEVVELIFCVNHMPFRVRGKVRMIRSEKLVGFQFPLLSDRVRRQLEDLVGELIENAARLHHESIANSPAQDDGKQPQAIAPQPARVATSCHTIRPVEVRPGNVAVRPEPRKRWF